MRSKPEAIEALCAIGEATKELRAAIAEKDAIIDEIKGIIGYPGSIALLEAKLSDSLPDVVRYTHRQWLHQMHDAGNRVIAEQMRADKFEAELTRLRALCGRAREIVGLTACMANQIHNKDWEAWNIERAELLAEFDAAAKGGERP